MWYEHTDPVTASRVEAWEFMVGGGASSNQLNSRFSTQDPAGNTPDNAQVMRALRNLRDFLHSFDFVKMRADKSFVISGVPDGVYCRGLSQVGEQYALYHHHSELARDQMYYIVHPGHYQETFVVALPGGTYREDWVDPASGSVISSATFAHQGGRKELRTFAIWDQIKLITSPVTTLVTGLAASMGSLLSLCAAKGQRLRPLIHES